jgi:putative ABC transport system permease protein
VYVYSCNLVGATSLDWRVLSFAVGVSLFTGILFGLLPAVRSSSMGARDALHSSSSRVRLQP